MDIGSNTTRLLVAEVQDGRVAELTTVREFTLLGNAIGPDGAIPAAKIDETAAAVSAQVQAAQLFGAERIRVVGTAVLRDAVNADQLAAAVERRAGCRLEVLTEAAEAALSFRGATAMSSAPGRGTVAVADVGGGSSEIAVGEVGHPPAWWHSLRIGSSVLARDCLRTDPPASAEIADCRHRAAQSMAELDPPRVTAALAVGGSATSLRRLAGPLLDPEALERTLDLLTGEKAADIADEYELDVRRVKLLPAGIAILTEISAKLGVPLEVAAGGLREGVLLGMAE